jgi:hypothetical protein
VEFTIAIRNLTDSPFTHPMSTVASNAHYMCLHSRPHWPDIPPGQERSMTGKLYFLQGGPEQLLARWKKDFGK